ncbi:ferric iron reductase [Agrobacterium vitis]|nr:ferric iron reductase [Allorhizobium ampelinum]MUO89078.1 ferric iron reductase [Agrobacterium vitis]MUZ53517.1 ferric iron reductase [Agrobacterium vitis]MUZ93479.1 ferric iron reductase [Agrobacterium vitis]MVA42341.1 ferric iron reductase [Agrobacterium vitis]
MTAAMDIARSEEALVRRALDAQAAYMPDVRADIGPADAEWTTTEAFFSDEVALGEFLAFEQSLNEGTDIKTAGALLMTDYAYILAAATVPIFAGFGLIPNLSPASVALSFYTTQEPHDGEMHRVRRAHVRFLEETFWQGQLGDAVAEERLRAEIERHFRPVIEAIHARTRLSRTALWRLAADAIAGRFLDSGRRFGSVEAAKASAMQILKVPGSPLANRQLHYFDLTVLDKNQQDFSYTFRQRGGCCRFYLVKGGEYCPTCVLKAPTERDEELRLAMRQHLGVADEIRSGSN